MNAVAPLHRFPMIIDGAPVAGRARFDVINPASGEVYAEAPDCSAKELDAAMAAAARAFPAWSADAPVRRATLHVVARLLDGAVDALAPVLTAEQGKPLANAAAEVKMAAAWFRYYADLTSPEEVVQDDAAVRVTVVRRPLGVVAAITPWNVPLGLAAWKLAPALAAGNTVVLKPSPYTPLATLMMGRLIAEALPPGALNVVSGGNELGAWMSVHPIPRKVSFTGSVATGKAVAAAAATDLKRVTLELGGNDPAILLEDVDVARIAEPLFWRAFANNGQVCAAVKRVYAPRTRYDEVVDALAAIARTVKVGDGADAGVRLGPINNAPQLLRVQGLVSDALASGARIAAGGARIEGPGYFFQPTVLSGVSDGLRIVDEEQFGPALPIVAYDDLDEAVRRANASHFGLGGSVWGEDLDLADTVAGRLDCGTTWVNDHMTLGPQQPFGGSKWSGIGAENGMSGLLAVTELQVRSRPKTQA